jgi:hypothetical protein
MMGPDFDKGLANLKARVEADSAPASKELPPEEPTAGDTSTGENP